METKLIFSENVHAYSYLGEPVPEIPRSQPIREGLCPNCQNPISTKAKNKTTCKKCKVKIEVGGFEVNALRKTTTKDFRKYGLFPSISRMCSYGEMPFELMAWTKQRTIQFVMDCWSDDDRIWTNRINAGLKDLENEYADRGSEGHGHIQKAMEGVPYQGDNPVYIRCIQEIRDWEFDMGISGAIREQSHCDPIGIGLGGCIDFACDNPYRIIADYKFKFSNKTFEDIKNGKRNYLDSAIKQLAGYAAISSNVEMAFVIVIRGDETHEDAGETLFIELTDNELAWGMKAITANTRAWFINQKYEPQLMYANDECWTLKQIMEQAGPKAKAEKERVAQ